MGWIRVGAGQGLGGKEIGEVDAVGDSVELEVELDAKSGEGLEGIVSDAIGLERIEWEGICKNDGKIVEGGYNAV